MANLSGPGKSGQITIVECAMLTIIGYMARPVERAEVTTYEQVYLNGENYTKMITPIVKTERQDHSHKASNCCRG
jgi:hypothetical protein